MDYFLLFNFSKNKKSILLKWIYNGGYYTNFNKNVMDKKLFLINT